MKKIALMMAAAILFTLSCGKPDNNGENGKDPNNGDDNVTEVNIAIDGEFADWVALPSSAYVKAENDPDSPWEAVDEIRVCADPDYVYYYIRFNADYMPEEGDERPIRLCLNTDGEFESGYENYFQECYDFIIEGALANESGEWIEYAGTMHQRVNGSWEKLLEPTAGVATGWGKGTEYEISVDRGIFSSGVMKSSSPNSSIGEVFQTGIRFYTAGWAELSNMPNDSEYANGWGPLLEVRTIGL